MSEATASKQELFAQLIAQGETQAAAYRKSHSAAKKWADKTVWEKASRLAKDLAPRINALREASTSAAILSATEAKEILSKIARNHIDMREKICDEDGVPVGEKDVPNRDRIAAIDRLAKMQGWDAAEKSVTEIAVVSKGERETLISHLVAAQMKMKVISS